MLSAIRVTCREEMGKIQNKFDAIVIGLGITGMSCVRYLADKVSKLAVVDTRQTPPQLDVLVKEFPDIPFISGEFDPNLLCSSKVLYLSPGVPLSSSALQVAMDSGVSVSSDIELFLNAAKSPVIAVTGSNGKSTVAKLISEMISGSGKQVLLGGNYGVPALELLTPSAPDFYVLELSSFQLETLNEINVAASTILNISEDHMDRYPSVQEYVNAKKKIFMGNGVKVINLDDPVVCKTVNENDKVLGFGLNEPQEGNFGVCNVDGIEWMCFGSKKILPVSELQITGRHNLSNSLASLALGNAIGLELDAMADSLKKFKGLPHRCERVININNVEWINDSKGTNPGATYAAIQGLAEGENIVLIAGGDSKGADLACLGDAVQGRVHSAILIGKDARRLEQAISARCQVYHATSLQGAVNTASQIARPGDKVLLSPACASLDMFENYADRGEKFSGFVRQLAGKGSPES